MSDRAEPRQRGSAHLQPCDEADLDEALPDDEQLDRLLGDQELLQRLQWSGYAMREWDRVAEEFARYGLGVLQPWIGTGRIFAKVQAKIG